MLGNSLQNKKIIISAGASGIGWATAKVCLSRGATVYLCDIDVKSLNKIKTKKIIIDPVIFLKMAILFLLINISCIIFEGKCPPLINTFFAPKLSNLLAAKIISFLVLIIVKNYNPL